MICVLLYLEFFEPAWICHLRPGLQKYCIDQFDSSYLSALDIIFSWYILLQIYYTNYFVYLLQISLIVTAGNPLLVLYVTAESSAKQTTPTV
jgi:hypothetical protein